MQLYRMHAFTAEGARCAMWRSFSRQTRATWCSRQASFTQNTVLTVREGGRSVSEEIHEERQTPPQRRATRRNLQKRGKKASTINRTREIGTKRKRKQQQKREGRGAGVSCRTCVLTHPPREQPRRYAEKQTKEKPTTGGEERAKNKESKVEVQQRHRC